MKTEMKWIKVEESLPVIPTITHNGYTFPKGTMSDWVIFFDEINGLCIGFYSTVTGWQSQEGENNNVTHWMPLPELPKTQNNETI